MKEALRLAQKAEAHNEVPVGAVIVKDHQIIAEGYNQKEGSTCATKHAEIIAIEQASQTLGSWRLLECDLYVTLEPCIMCAGAIFSSRISKVFFGTPDPKGGALGSLYRIHEDTRLNHQFTVSSGLMKKECAEMLKNFSLRKRGASLEKKSSALND